MDQYREKLLMTIESAYRRSGRFSFAVDPDYPTLYDHYGIALGGKTARQYVDTHLDQIRLLVEGRLSGVAFNGLVEQRRSLLRGHERDLAYNIESHVLRTWSEVNGSAR
jgi:plasmid stabilization system protein ParE